MLGFRMRRIFFRSAEKSEPFLSMRCRMGVQRRMIYARRRTWDLTIVGWGIEIYDVEAVLQKIYTRYK
jgi:hypothetical protein